MRISFLIFLLAVLASCNLEKTKRKRVGDKIVETVFINDSTYSGVTKYYSLEGKLESKISFFGGIKEGPAVNYYNNGKMHDSIQYSYGYENGFHYVFDTLGGKEYTDFFFFGKRIGDRKFYKKGRLYEYEFLSFDGKLLFSMDYDTSGIPISTGREVINLNGSRIFLDNNPMLNLTLYILCPPRISINYSLGILDIKSNKRKILDKINDSNKPFLDTLLPLPNKGNYFIQADYYDTLNNIHTIHIQPIEMQ